MIKKYTLLISIILIGCLENPFSKTNISEDGSRLITGRVIVAGEQDPSGVFVWLEELNLQTWTDSKGEFKIKLPVRSSSTPGGGTTGYMNIYYYISNYGIRKSQVFVFDGAFKYSEADLNESGQIKETIVLEKIVDISISITKPIPIEIYKVGAIGKTNQNQHIHTNAPYPVQLLSNDSIQIHLECISLTKDPIIIASIEDSDNFLMAMFFKPVTNQNNALLTISEKGILKNNFVYDRFLRDSKSIMINEINFSAGLYEVHPFLIIKQDIPQGLIETFSENASKVHEDYFTIPMRYTPGLLEIRN